MEIKEAEKTWYPEYFLVISLPGMIGTVDVDLPWRPDCQVLGSSLMTSYSSSTIKNQSQERPVNAFYLHVGYLSRKLH